MTLSGTEHAMPWDFGAAVLLRLVPFMLLCLPAKLPAQGPSDAEAMSLLLRNAAAESAARVTQGRVLLRVIPPETPVLVTQVFAEELQSRSHHVVRADADADAVMTVDVREMYSSTVSSGKTSYLRMMHATLGILLEDHVNSEITWSRELQISRTDTLDGTAPYSRRLWLEDHSSFWGDLLESLLVTAGAAVIAILLFTVRGS